MKFFNIINNKGFTLIEILVVVSILGLLSSITLVSLQSARSKARDAKRIMALRQIKTAIDLYASDHDGVYPGYAIGENTYVRSPANSGVSESGNPVSRCGYGAPGTGGGANYVPGIWCKFETLLSPYLAKLPDTEIINSNYFYYTYKVPSMDIGFNPNAVKAYGLSVVLENANAQSKNDGGYYDNVFELGDLPSYCKNKNSSWISWSSAPCSCTSYPAPYYSGCTY